MGTSPGLSGRSILILENMFVRTAPCQEKCPEWVVLMLEGSTLWMCLTQEMML